MIECDSYEDNKTPCSECNGTGNMSIEKDTVHIPCLFCGGYGFSL